MRFRSFAAIRKSILKIYRRFKTKKVLQKHRYSFVASAMVAAFTLGYLNCSQKHSERENNPLSIKHQFLKIDPIASKDENRFGKNQMMFDAAIVPFEETKQGKLYIQQHGKPDIYDSSGYPPLSNVYQNLKTDGKKRAWHEQLVEKAYADDLGQLPGEVNCRENETVAGYFKAFFEDVAAGTGVGYDDSTFGQARRTAVCDVLREIATLIKLDQTNTTPDIVFTITPDGMPSNALASASAYYGTYQNLAGPDNGTVYKHITTGQDPTPTLGSFDALVNTNFQVSWSVDSQLDANTYDFHTVMWHEFLHALGFMSSLPAVIGNSDSPIDHNTFSEHLYEVEPTSTTNRYFSFVQQLAPVLQAPSGAPSAWFVNNASMYQGRKNIVNAPLDGARPLYTPLAWEQGSSISHFDMNRAPGMIYVMHPSIGAGIERNVHEHEKEVLCHLGYQVLGMAGCEEPSPVANDDETVSGGYAVCIPLITNDLSFSGGNLSIDSIEWIIEPTGAFIDFYTSDYCENGALISPSGAYGEIPTIAPINARSIQILQPSAQPSIAPLAEFKYVVRDSVANRLSLPATAKGFYAPPVCNVPTDEYVCNGNFELVGTQCMNQIYNIITLEPTNSVNMFFISNSYTTGCVPGWSAALESPSLVHNFYPSNIFSGFPATTNNMTIDMVDGGSWAAFMAPIEKMATKLKQPLVVGEDYILSFDVNLLQFAFSSLPTPLNERNVQVAFSTQDLMQIAPCCLTPSPALASAVPVFDQPILVNIANGTPAQAQWAHIEFPFTATQAFEYMAIHQPIQPTNGTYSYADPAFNDAPWVYVDNVSIKGPPLNFISGNVYNDLNLNGTQNSGELGLAGVTVGLFSTAVSTTPIQTVTTNAAMLGSYKFENLNPAAQYFVAIISENTYQEITQPVQNSLLAGFQHAIQVPFGNGGQIANQNFGIMLNEQGVDLIVTDDITWKTASDMDYGNEPVAMSSVIPTDTTHVDFRVAIKNIGGSAVTLPTDDELMDFQLFKITGLLNQPQIATESGFQDGPVIIPPGGIHYVYLHAIGKPNTLMDFLGTFAIRVEVDTANAVFETNENNNLSPVKTFIVVPN